MTKRRRGAHELAAVAETMPVKDGGRDARDEGVNYARWGQAVTYRVPKSICNEVVSRRP